MRELRVGRRRRRRTTTTTTEEEDDDDDEDEEEDDDDDEDEDEDEGARVTAAYPVVHPKATAEHVPCQDRSGAWPNHEPTLLNLLTPSLDPC